MGHKILKIVVGLILFYAPLSHADILTCLDDGFCYWIGGYSAARVSSTNDCTSNKTPIVQDCDGLSGAVPTDCFDRLYDQTYYENKAYIYRKSGTGSWSLVVNGTSFYSGSPFYPDDYNSFVPPTISIPDYICDPSNTCPDLPAIAAAACGGGIEIIDEELCFYTCASCENLAQVCEETCGPLAVSAFSCTETDGEVVITQPCVCNNDTCNDLQDDCYSTCNGFVTEFVCNTNEFGNPENSTCVCDPCSEDTFNFAEINCGGLEYLENFDCNTNSGSCLDVSCNQFLSDCQTDCSGTQIATYFCDSNDTVSRECVCVDDIVTADTVVVDPWTLDTDLTDNTDIYGDPDNRVATETPSSAEDTDSTLLQKIVDNTNAASLNIKALHDSNSNELNELNRHTENSNLLLNQINSSLNADTTMDMGVLNMPADNFYDTTIEQPAEESFSDTLTSYITSGLPLQTFIEGSGFIVSGSDPVLDCNLWGQTVKFDISPMESILKWMGLVVFAVSTVTAFMIVVKK